MVTVRFEERKGQYHQILIEGHADSSSEEGHDLVCAAVSSISIGALNALENLDHFDIVVENGYVKINVLRKISSHDQTVLETMMIQLSTIEESYGAFIRINPLANKKEGASK